MNVCYTAGCAVVKNMVKKMKVKRAIVFDCMKIFKLCKLCYLLYIQSTCTIINLVNVFVILFAGPYHCKVTMDRPIDGVTFLFRFYLDE